MFKDGSLPMKLMSSFSLCYGQCVMKGSNVVPVVSLGVGPFSFSQRIITNFIIPIFTSDY
jgi:hypothetical protein